MSEAKLDKAIRDEERWAWEGLCSVCDQAMRPNDDGFPPDSEEQAICNNCIWDERDRLKQELATLRANQLPAKTVEAVKVYAKAHLEAKRAFGNLPGLRVFKPEILALDEAIEAEMKECEA